MATRTRSRSTSYPYSMYFTRLGFSGPMGGALSSPMSETMIDTVTPNYFKMKRLGQTLPVNSMSQDGHILHETSNGSTVWRREQKSTKITVGFTQADGHLGWSYWHTKTGLTQGFYNAWGGPALPSWPLSSEVLTEALANARTSATDIGTFAAELTKTAGMIAAFRTNVFNRAHKIANTITSRKDRNWSRSGAIAAFADQWLEYRYGWRTLGYDISDINESLVKLRSVAAPLARGHASKKASLSVVRFSGTSLVSATPTGTLSTNNIARVDGSITDVRELTVKADCGVTLLANNIAFVDPLVTTWEIIPFSFIVDWFTNINDNIAAYSPFAVGNVAYCSLTSSDVWTTSTSVSCKEPVWNPVTDNMYLTGTPAYHMNHVKVSSTRVPANPSFSLSIDLNLDSSKLLDLASIFFLKRANLIRGLLNRVRL